MRLQRITKSFGATRAVDDVSLEIRAGEVLAIVGENGAGKTTLMRIAAGELAADGGSVIPSAVEGSPAGGDASTALGMTRSVALVHQHFMLVPAFSIADNLALQSGGDAAALHTRRTREREAARIIEDSGIALHDPSRLVADLSVGEKSKLELIKAIATHPEVLILDEPTSVLTPTEAEELFAVMRTLATNGAAIVFISHKLPEVLAVADRVVVMREGKVVLETSSITDANELATAMIQVRGDDSSHPSSALRAPSPRAAGRRGIGITAIVGVTGNGQAQLANDLRKQHPEAAHIPEDRTRDGIVAQMTIVENLALRGVQNAEEVIARYSIRASGPRQRAGDLSGGNQQKVVLARELERHPRMIVASEPTRGLDIEATAFVHDRLREAAANGASILLITSDLDEAFALADAIQVIYRGKLSERMTPEEAATRVAGLMAGLA